MDGINKKFEDTKYYLNLLSLYLKNSYGIEEQIKIMTDIFTSLDNFYEEYTKSLSLILSEESDLNNKEDFLEKLGSIFNCSRSLSIPFTDTGLTVYDLMKEDTKNSRKNITLTNEELLVYIKASIVKYNFNGTMDELNQLYNETNRYTKLNFTYLFTSTSEDSLTCNIYFNNYQDFEKTGSKNIRNLFLNHMLTIESMGIVYNLVCLDARDIGVFGTSVYYANQKIEPVKPEDPPLYNGKIDLTKHLWIEKYTSEEDGTVSDTRFFIKYYNDKKETYKEDILESNTTLYKIVKNDNNIYDYENISSPFSVFSIDKKTDNSFELNYKGSAICHYLLEIELTIPDKEGNDVKRNVGVFIIVENVPEYGRPFYIAGSTKLGRFSS